MIPLYNYEYKHYCNYVYMILVVSWELGWQEEVDVM